MSASHIVGGGGVVGDGLSVVLSRLSNIRKTIRDFGVLLSHEQLQYHELLINASMPLIKSGCMEDEMKSNPKPSLESALTKSNKWMESTAMVTFVIALVTSVPAVNVSIFCVGLRCRDFIIATIVNKSVLIPNTADRITIRTFKKNDKMEVQVGCDIDPLQGEDEDMNTELKLNYGFTF